MKKHILLATIAISTSAFLSNTASAHNVTTNSPLAIRGFDQVGIDICSWNPATQTSDEAWEKCMEKVNKTCQDEETIGVMVALFIDGADDVYGQVFVPCP